MEPKIDARPSGLPQDAMNCPNCIPAYPCSLCVVAREIRARDAAQAVTAKIIDDALAGYPEYLRTRGQHD